MQNKPRPIGVQGFPKFDEPPLLGQKMPRCPPYIEVESADHLLPYLDVVANRPYNQGLHAAWDLKPGERVLLRVDNWHSEMVVEACQRILEKYKCKYEIMRVDKGPIKEWVGADEVEYYLNRTQELVEWMDAWDQIAKDQNYDKLLWGYGGPILVDDFVKIQRMPFITPEILASPAHAMPYELLQAIDEYTWKRVRQADRVRITDPEGTDISFTNHAEYYDKKREYYNWELISKTWTDNPHFAHTYLPGHVTGRPWIFLPGKEDGNGVIAGTTNHIAPVDWTQLIVENSKITEINEGGDFGDKLRAIMAETDDQQYPGMPGKGLMHWREASIGTNPHIHRPRKDFPSGFVNCLYERVRSGVIHMGFGTIISSMDERRAAREGLKVGHWHLHLYFPDYYAEIAGQNEMVIEKGRLTALDAPEIQKMAQKHGKWHDPDLWLQESWIPAVPGINVKGDYWDHYAKDPLKWVKTELDICQNWHHLFAEMVGGEPKYCNDDAGFWTGACVGQPGLHTNTCHSCGGDH